MSVLLETSLGDIVVDLYVEERPKCSVNFLKLCKIKYYNFVLFFSVQRSFIAQAGDPGGSGEGGQSVWGALKGDEYRYFEAETSPRLKHLKAGTLSMVNNGNGCHASQFLLTLREGLDELDSGGHTVFGEVAEGFDVLTKISEAYCDEDGRPYQDIRIYHTVVLEDPFDDPEGLQVPERSPSPPKVVTDSNRIGAEEDIDDYKGLTEDQIRELISQREAKANAQVLEMVGDIPDADAKPPENVLFVCKLNPVTTDEDLEIIFSRFGAILSCEVIRDQKTGDSLQYAFIEFENEEDCIKAYFKMDNVLIDDRRIHVDFSQSLAKVKGISRRKYSEEDPEGERRGSKRDDGLVEKRKARDDGYEMLFGDGGEDDVGEKGRSKEGAKRSKVEGRAGERERDRKGGGGERRERREEEGRGGGGRDRRRGEEASRKGRREGGSTRGEEQHRSGRHKQSRSRSRDRHSRHRKHGRSRSRSRSIDRRRSRSRSRDRSHRRK